MGRFLGGVSWEARAARSVGRSMRRRPLSWIRFGLLPLLAAAAAGCGGDAPKTEPSSAQGAPAATGPLARWRRSTEPGVWGRPVVIEALRDCRVRLAFRLRDAGAPDRIENRRDVRLGAGDAMKISLKVERTKPAYSAAPPETDRVAERSNVTTHLFHTQIDTEADMVRSDPVWTKETNPWVRVERTEPPPDSLDFPDGEVALAAIGVADGVAPAESDVLRLDLSTSPPRLVGGSPAPPGAARHVTAFVVSVLPAND
jgi:hypothetical protein